MLQCSARLLRRIRFLFLPLLLAGGLLAQTDPSWTQPFPAFKIVGNVYYVGSRGLASYLITTPKGHILINSNLVSSVPQIRDSVEKLGFRFSAVKILLISHAHWDHDAGSAEIKKLTGAQYMVMDADVPMVESGGKDDFQYANIAADYEKTFRVLKQLPCDIFLGAHGSYYNMEEKFAKLKNGGANPFVDPEGYQSFVDDKEQAFRSELAKQSAAEKSRGF